MSAALRWWISGGLLSFAIQSRVSIGFFLLLPAAFLVLLCVIVDFRGLWMGLAGFATVASGVSLTLVLDPNAPEDSLIPTIAWAVLAALSYLLHWKKAFPARRIP